MSRANPSIAVVGSLEYILLQHYLINLWIEGECCVSEVASERKKNAPKDICVDKRAIKGVLALWLLCNYQWHNHLVVKAREDDRYAGENATACEVKFRSSFAEATSQVCRCFSVTKTDKDEHE